MSHDKERNERRSQKKSFSTDVRDGIKTLERNVHRKLICTRHVGAEENVWINALISWFLVIHRRVSIETFPIVDLM